jgi:hypothetical protein
MSGIPDIVYEGGCRVMPVNVDESSLCGLLHVVC